MILLEIVFYGWMIVSILILLGYWLVSALKEIWADLVKFRDRMAGSEPNPSADYYKAK